MERKTLYEEDLVSWVVEQAFIKCDTVRKKSANF
jgi:hypothetical protein